MVIVERVSATGQPVPL